MNRLALIVVAGVIGIGASVSFGPHHGGRQHSVLAAVDKATSSRSDALIRQPVKPRSTIRPKTRSHVRSAADETLRAFMDARMHRNAAAAKPHLSAHAKDQFCDDPICIRLIGTSNPHFASWELVSRTDEGRGKVRFLVRIQEEVTGQGETDQRLERIEIGPGENYLGQPMDAVVLSVS